MAGADDSYTNIDELQMARSAAVELQRGTVLAGRYEIEATLGRGGAGLVLRAQDRELREAVAIKVLRPDLGNAARWNDRLAREVKLARQLRHPNVCRVFDFEKAEGHVFIVMELAKGGSLRRELDDGTLLARTLEARLADARAVAAGLAAIHDAGIAHRDVTPQNVLRMGDGRVVVSDFGLATEISQTTTSIHGGTIAYMAPEVVRGQRASFASDVWALGVLIHEIVFGARPTWSKPVGGTLVAPGGGRTLPRGERLAFAVCRACTAEDPAKRPRSARDVEEWLAGHRPVHSRIRHGILAASLLALALSVTAVELIFRSQQLVRPSLGAPPIDPLMLPIAPGAADWTQTSTVLASINAEVGCLVALPDRQTLRYVWGSPARAVDLDTRSGKERPAPLLPEAFQKGCPDVSPSGQVLFQGHLSDGSPHAFVSPRSDGGNATPTIAIAEPSLSSEPKWTSDGTSFVFEADLRHAGAFSTTTRQVTILPEPTRSAYLSIFKFVTDRRIFLNAILVGKPGTELVGFDWPSLKEVTRFRLPGLSLDVKSFGNDILVSLRRQNNGHAVLVDVDPSGLRAREFGSIAHQSIRDPVFVENGLAFRSWRASADIWTRGLSGAFKQLSHDGAFVEAFSCGDGLLATEISDSGSAIVRLDRAGRIIAKMTPGPEDHSPSCAIGGTPWFFIRGEGEALLRCDDSGCRTLARGAFNYNVASPDGRRLLLLKIENAGPTISWMPSEGGSIRDLGLSETTCSPGWSSNATVWISRRKSGRFLWTEVDTDTGKETGRTVNGTTNCSNGGNDPSSPVDSQLRIDRRIATQIRLLPRTLLEPPWSQMHDSHAPLARQRP